jgi:hypothetical protein
MADDTPDDTPQTGAETPPGDERKVTRLADRRKGQRAVPVTAATEPHLVRLAKARDFLGNECPYEPLGADGEMCWVQQASGHVRGIRPKDLSRNMMVMVCGNEKWLERKYPKFRRGKPVAGFAADTAVNQLIDACHTLGFWSQDQHVRGVGAWLGEDGDLVLHRGDHLFVKGKRAPLGRHGEFVYVPDRALPTLPLRDKLDGTATAGSDLLARLDTFQWRRGSFDAYLMFCWICAANVGGALPFRPHVWVTGEFGQGKSTLQLLLSTVFGAPGLLSVTDATAAGIWQTIQFRSVPIGCDEMEPQSEGSRAANVVNFARQASTGGHVVRGTGSHTAAEFTIRSAFCCSSIIVPPMPSQDLSRFALLDLASVGPSRARAPFDLDRLERIGAALTLRLASRFDFMVKEAIPAYRAALTGAGFPARAADMYSALFGCGAVGLHDSIEEMRVDAFIEGHQVKRILGEAVALQTPEWRRMVAHLLSSRVERMRMESVTIGELMAVAAGPLLTDLPQAVMPGILLDDKGGESLPDDNDGRASKARERLLQFGLRISRRPGPDGELIPYLLIANAHRQLAELFGGTVWRTVADAAAGGGWTQVARRAPGAIQTNGLAFRSGVVSRTVGIPLALVLELGAGPSPDAPTGTRADVGDPATPVGEDQPARRLMN